MLGAAGVRKVCGGCGRVHVNLQEMQESIPSVLCGAALQQGGEQWQESMDWRVVAG